ncbi:hypothetical protein ScPMuIL_007095 [Solemya velum]
MMDALSGSRPHQGVCMDVSKLVPPPYSSLPIKGDIQRVGVSPVWLMPYKVQDPMNLGAILRSAHFLGVEKVVLPQKHSCSLSAVVSKASAGALEVMDLVMCPDERSLSTLLQHWKKAGGRLVGAVSPGPGAVPVHEYIANSPTLLIIGNEGMGLDDGVLNQCDILVSINQSTARETIHSKVDSLNVSVATGILLHSILQSRNGGS